MRIGLVAISVCILAAGAPEDIDRALAKARKDNKRVLVVQGRVGDEGSVKLEKMLEDRAVARTILYEYELEFEMAGEVEGTPILTILDGDGKTIARKDKADSMSAEELKAFLEKHKAAPANAETVYTDALGRAKKEDKRLMVHLGAPW